MKILLTTVLMFLAVNSWAIFGLEKIRLIEAKLADQIKMADTINNKLIGQENHIKELNAKLEMNTNAIAGVNNTVSKVSAGRDMINDSALMKEYIEALKASAKGQAKLYQYVIGGLLAQMGVLISLLGWCLKFMMKSGRDDDRFKERMIESSKKINKGA